MTITDTTLYRTLFQTAPVAAWMQDRHSGAILDANDAAAALFAYPKQELLSMTRFSLQPADEAQRLRDFLARNPPVSDWTSEGVWTHFNSRQEPLRLHVASCLTSRGDAEVVMLLARDVSKDEETAAKLQRSEQLLKLAIQAADIGTWKWNVQTGQAVLDERLQRLTRERDLPIDTHLTSYLRYLDHHDLDGLWESARLHFRNETEIRDVRYRLRLKDGDVAWVHECSKVVEWDASGAPLTVTAVYCEETDRYNADIYRRALDKASDPVIVFVRRRLRFANAAALQILGASKLIDLLDWTPEDLTHPDDATQLREFAQTLAQRADAGNSIRQRLVRLDGSTVWVELKASAAQTPEGDEVCVFLRSAEAAKSAGQD
jgi:PAS domain S-box-containing protein